MTLSFGKYKGKRIEDVPMKYLRYLLELPDDKLDPERREQAQAMFKAKIEQRRAEEFPHAPPDQSFNDWRSHPQRENDPF